jgi:AsmA protein
MSISDGAISFSDGRTGAAFSVDAVQLTATQADPDGAIHLDANATERGVPLAVSGDVGRPHDQFMPIDLTLKAEGADLTVRGKAQQFALSGSIADLAALSPLAGRTLPALHDIAFQAELSPPPGGTLASGLVLDGIRIDAPTGGLTGNAAVTLAPNIAIRAVVTTRSLDVAALLAALPASHPAAAPPAVAAAAAPATPPAPAPNWVISDRVLPFGVLPRLDADVTLTALDTKAGEATIKSVATHAVLHAGRLILDPVRIDGPGGHAEGNAMADATGAAAITLHAPALSIQPLLDALDQPDGVQGVMDVRVDLHGAGTTLHALVASLDGNAGLALANGEIDNRLLVWLLSRIAPEAGLLDFAGKAQHSDLRCVALRADVAHGVADLRALLLDTAPLRLTGSGTVDLGQETLSLRLQPLARIGGSGFSVPVAIGGSFRAPRARIDSAGAGRSLGGIVIGALGADRLIAGAGETDGCDDQLKLARFGDPGPVPPALPAQAEGKPAKQDLNNLLKQLLR